MIRAVIFDMFETLITHYRCPLYFSMQMAADAGIPEESFQALWKQTEDDRSTGKAVFEDVLGDILRDNRCYTDELLQTMAEKRIATKRECFEHLHPQIMPMLTQLREHGMRIGLISNCFSEEAAVIRESALFPYFDAAMLSWEQGVQKPDEEIFRRCMERLQVKAEECLYIGDGGSCELETARRLGMTAAQAVWYFQAGMPQSFGRKNGFPQLEAPLDVLTLLGAPTAGGSRPTMRIEREG